MKSNRAFTIMELLIVTAILGAVTAVIGACISGGIKVWDRARKFSMVEAPPFIGMRMMEKDLMNSFRFCAVGFSGEPQQMSFPGLLKDQKSATKIGTIKYFFDKKNATLFRKTWAYPGDEPDNQYEKIISGLEEAKIQYYRRSAEEIDGTGWQDFWNDDTNFPDRVRITLSFPDESEMAEIEDEVFIEGCEI